MQVRLSAITGNPERIVLTGDEDWFEEVFGNLLADTARERPSLYGWFELKPGFNGVVELTGHIHIDQVYLCRSCENPKAWRVDESFEMWLPPLEQLGKANEDPLSPSWRADDLDSTYVHDGILDLAELISDRLNLILPTSSSRLRSSTACALCAEVPNLTLGQIGDRIN